MDTQHLDGLAEQIALEAVGQQDPGRELIPVPAFGITLDVERGPQDLIASATWLVELCGMLGVDHAGREEALTRGIERVREYAPSLVDGMTAEKLRSQIVAAIREQRERAEELFSDDDPPSSG